MLTLNLEVDSEVEVVVSKVEVAEVVAVEDLHQNNKSLKKITINYLEFLETLMMRQLRKSLRNWQSNTIQIRTKMILRLPSRCSRR